MLAYVFWHWPRPGEEARLYEERLAAFHQVLAGRRVPGFFGSRAFRLVSDPRLPPGRAGYQDWYLLDGSASLDVLNEAALDGPCRAPHDDVAARAEGGLGGLLRLRHGSFEAGGSLRVTWFGKPEGMTYEAFYPWAGAFPGAAAASLWRRQMVLGPGPEFAFVGREAVRLPAGLPGFEVAMEAVWAGPLTSPPRRPGSAGAP